MENQMNVGNQNTQQIGQNPANQPVNTSEKPQMNYLMVGGIVLACFVVFGFGAYYLGKHSSSLQLNNIGEQYLPSPTTTSEAGLLSPTPQVTTNASNTANWTTYTDTTFNVSIKYPDEWNYQGLAPNFILFKPKNYQIPEGVEAEAQGVTFTILHFNY